MNIKARFALEEVIAGWAKEYEVLPEEEIRMLEKQLQTSKEALAAVRQELKEEVQ